MEGEQMDYLADFSPDFHNLETLKAKMREVAATAPVFGRLANYIDQNMGDILFMTANELAAEVGISQGSVSRFCNALGCRGYGSFQHAMRTFVRNPAPMASQQEYLSSLDNIDQIIHAEKANLDALKETFANHSYEAMLKRLIDAKRIIFLASRVSGTLVEYFCYQLKRLGKDASVIDENNLIWESIELMDPKKIEIFTVMYPQYPHNLIFKLERLKAKKFSVMGVTDRDLSPLCSLADPVLCLPTTKDLFFGSYSTTMLFFSILLQDIVSKDKRANEIMTKLSAIEEETYVYHRFAHKNK